ncbi:hypothetical protein P171DRAFT_525041 [Karstenula rhodostoma CBS 690.94]|uniref:Uncharacterized protein n=1 Tax=Karstenula rhodostoma CBS 690.94 TaxID=1392251 RepID=A0A9P4U8B4_9PLEO|nr:hypothetical protein P171DRAFT_525041 [Karstenula rhodostoma CBS 690.94]
MSHSTAIGTLRMPMCPCALHVVSATGLRQAAKHKTDFKIAGRDHTGRFGNPEGLSSSGGTIANHTVGKEDIAITAAVVAQYGFGPEC